MERLKFITKLSEVLKEHKRKVISVFIVLAMIPVGSMAYEAIFQVKGVVTSTDESTITVANFYRTQTLDLEGIPVNTTIQPGDSVFVQKNIQGNIINVKVRSSDNNKHMLKRWIKTTSLISSFF